MKERRRAHSDRSRACVRWKNSASRAGESDRGRPTAVASIPALPPPVLHGPPGLVVPKEWPVSVDGRKASPTRRPREAGEWLIVAWQNRAFLSYKLFPVSRLRSPLHPLSNERPGYGGNDGRLPRFGKHRPGRARRAVPGLRRSQSARASPAQGPHRGEEGVLRLRALQSL